MYQTKTWKSKFSLFMIILGPIFITQISYMMMNVFDTMMSGRAGTDDLAGVAIGSSLWMPVLLGLNGIFLSVTPIVAQLFGRGQKQEIASVVSQALYLTVLVSLVVVVAGLLALDPILSIMNLETSVHYIAKHYLIGLALGVLPLFAANVLRNFFDAQGHTWLTMLISLLGVPINFLLNYLLIFGNFGFPRLGGIGAGYATALTYWLILFISIWVATELGNMREYRLFREWFKPSWKAWKEQLSIGVPIGLSIFFEVSIFAAVTLLIGKMYDTITVAAHQAAFNFTSLVFMLPLSISLSLTIVVAFEVGAGRYQDARQYTRFGVATAIGLQAILCVILYVYREPISYLYTNDPKVAVMTVHFLIFAIFYQISDAIQASLQGVLRGYKDVTIPFVIALISYWMLGIPSGIFLSEYTTLGPYGYWVGITVGLTCAAIGFLIRLQFVGQRKLKTKTRRQIS